LIFGWYGTETLGDKAILSGLAASLRATGWSGAIDLASLEPYVSRQTQREMPELQLRSILPFAQAREKVAHGEYRVVAIGGGPLMSPIPEIYDLLGFFTDAAAAGSARGVLGCGIGPLGFSQKRNTAIADILKISNVTVLRDSASLELARQELNFAGEAEVAPDPAFIWASRLMQARRAEARDDVVLLALRDWQIHEYGQGLSAREAALLKARFERELLALVDELQRLVPEWKIRPLAMHTHARGGDDRMFFQRLFTHRPRLLDAISWKRVPPAQEFRSFRAARAVVAMRFHSAVLATAAQTPHAVIDYTRGGKVAALLSALQSDAPRWSIENFSGKDCAVKLLEAAGRPQPGSPSGVEDAYIRAWQRALDASGDWCPQSPGLTTCSVGSVQTP
jgi:polysaccharide pyruvyl transferase WcaK-like protein